MRRMTSNAAFSLQRRMLIGERTLLVSVALDTRGVGARREPCLFQLESTMRIVAIAAFHHAFHHLVMKWLGEIRFHFGMAAHTELWLAQF